MEKPYYILFKYATIGRPERFFAGLDTIYQNLSDNENFHVLVAAGEDDLTMNNGVVQAKLSTYKNCTIIYGENTGKVQATNAYLDLKGREWDDWDILVNMADDMRWIIYGFDQMIRDEMKNHFPDCSGQLHFPEPDTKEMLAVMYIAGRKWFERRGCVIAYPEYKSLFFDNDEQDSSKLCGKYAYIPYQIFTHLCPAYAHNNLSRDSIFDRDQSLWNYDENIYNARRLRNFDLNL